MRIAYRVYEAADGCGLVYCGEFASFEEAEAAAEEEPGGVEESVWSTLVAAYDDRAPDPRGVEADTPIGWYGERGWHCVVEVRYS
jgi:uncharacterized membrane protein